MPETSSDQLITASDLTANPPLRLNRVISQLTQQIAAVQGVIGPVNFRNSVNGTHFYAATDAIPTQDTELLTFGAAKALFGPNAQLSAFANKQFLGQPVSPLPPGPGSSTFGTTIIEASQFCGNAGLSDLCINKAIQSAPAAGAAIHCKAGIWKINATILMNKPNILLYGDGPGTIFQVNPTSNFPAGVIQVTAGDTSIQSLDCNGGINASTELNIATLFGAMAGDPSHPTLTNNSMIWISNGVSTFWLYDMTIENCGGYAVFGDCRFANLSNINISGVLLQNNVALVYGGTVSGTTYHGCGSWLGGMFFCGGGDGVNPYGYNNVVYPATQVTGLSVTDCNCQNITGNAIWAGFTYTTTNLHSKVSVQGNQLSDIGTDGIEMGDVQTYVVSGNYLHRVGYVAGAPAYLPGHNGTAIDTAGYAPNGQYTNNTMLNCNGGCMDLDGMSDAIVSGNTMTISWNTDPLYTADQVASYGYSPGATQNITTGIQTNGTFDPRGGQRVLISGNTIKNMGNIAILLFNAQSCLVSGNTIWHAGNSSLGATAIDIPILLATSGTLTPPYTSPPRFCQNNVITGNTITYDVAGLAYCIAESDAFGGAVNGPNFVYNNTLIGSNLGEFLPSSGGLSGGSNTSYTFHTNSTVSTQSLLSKTVTQREGTGKIAVVTNITQASSGVVTSANHPFLNGDVVSFQAMQGMVQINGVSGTVSGVTTNTFVVAINTSGFGAYTAGGFATVALTGVQRWYNTNLATGSGVLAGSLVDSGVFNASVNGMAFSGAFTTGGRSTFSILSDFLYTGKAVLDGYMVMGMYNLSTAFYDNEANTLNDSFGVMRYRRPGALGSGGILEISVSTLAGARVWSSIGAGGGVAPSDTYVQYNKAGAFGADSNLTWLYAATTGGFPTPALVIVGGTGAAAYPALVVTDSNTPHVAYVRSDGGFASGNTSYQAVNIPSGGVAARSVLASTYMFVGQSSGVPTTTPGDSFPANGNIYYDTGTNTFQGRQSGGWVTFATGGSVSPGGSTNSVQVNNAGSFSAGALTFNLSTNVLTVGTGGVGFASAPGYVVTGNAWNAINGGGSGAGAYLSGSLFVPFGSQGGYVDMAPLGYASFPVVLTGSSGFGATDALLWVSTANGTVTAVTSVGLQTNTFVNAAAGFVTAATAANAIQAPSGGMLAQTLALEVASPSGTSYPTATFFASSGPRGRIFGPVNSSANLFISENLSWSGSVWNADGISASYAMIQLSSVSSGVTFAIYTGLAASNPVTLGSSLSINTIGNTGLLAAPSATAGVVLTVGGLASFAGIVVTGGFIQSAQGFFTASGAVTAINVPSGGAQFGLDVQLRNLFMLGQAGTPATPTTGYGAITWSGSGAVYKVWNGSTYISANLATTGAVSSVTGSGAGISITPTTGAVVVTNTGVTSLTAGTGVTLSAATGAVTVSIGQSVATSASVIFSVASITSASSSALSVTGGINCSAIYASSAAFNALSANGGLAVRTNASGSAGSGVNVNDFTSNGTVVINNSHIFVGQGVNTPNFGVAASGFNPFLSPTQYFGQTSFRGTLSASGGGFGVCGQVFVSGVFFQVLFGTEQGVNETNNYVSMVGGCYIGFNN